MVAGQPYLVGEAGREWFIPTVNGTISTSPPAGQRVVYQITGPLVVFQNPPTTLAQADEYGRTIADSFHRRVQDFTNRQRGLRKVA